jgi:hypothetical protein
VQQPAQDHAVHALHFGALLPHVDAARLYVCLAVLSGLVYIYQQSSIAQQRRAWMKSIQVWGMCLAGHCSTVVPASPCRYICVLMRGVGNGGFS